MTTETITTNQTWTPPAAMTVTIEGWGKGGIGGDDAGLGGGGGAGAPKVTHSVAVTPAVPLVIAFTNDTTITQGGVTIFVAKVGVSANEDTPGIASTTGCVGTTFEIGQNGSAPSGGNGGRGGDAGGPDGGAGGAGGTVANGSAGTDPGGASGGAKPGSSGSPGARGAGRVVLTYTVPATAVINSVSTRRRRRR